MFQAFGAAMLKARSPNLSLDRGRNRSRFDADLRTVGRVDNVKTVEHGVPVSNPFAIDRTIISLLDVEP